MLNITIYLSLLKFKKIDPSAMDITSKNVIFLNINALITQKLPIKI